jgi:5-methylcytosine-specific restriction endonuclease McrA
MLREPQLRLFLFNQSSNSLLLHRKQGTLSLTSYFIDSGVVGRFRRIMRTLILNAGYEPMVFVSWQRAICLVLSQRAEIVASYGEDLVRTVSDSFPLPSVVKLNRYVNLAGRIGLVNCNRKNVLMRDDFKCQYCGIHCSTASATIDHVLPISRGGRTSWENVVTACSECNNKKASKTPAEARMPLKTKPRRLTWRKWIELGQKHMDAAWMDFLN